MQITGKLNDFGIVNDFLHPGSVISNKGNCAKKYVWPIGNDQTEQISSIVDIFNISQRHRNSKEGCCV